MTCFPLQRLLPALLALTLLGVTGCESNRRARIAERLEEERKSVPPMEGKDTFFDGQLTAFVSLGSGLAGLPGARTHARHGKGFNPKFMGVHAGAGDSGGGFTREPDAFGFGPSSEVPRDQVEEMQRPMLGESPMPPVLLVIDLANTSKELIEVEFVDFTSELGDFAVRPATMKLAPGESAQSDPMTSRLGLTSYALPVTVALRVNGKTERKIITLTPLPPEATPPAPAR